jgi:hypothetical protein
MRIATAALALALAAGLAGCASTVTHSPEPAGGAAASASVEPRAGRLELRLSGEAQKMAADNPVFSVDQLRQTLERTLRERGVLVAGHPQVLEIELLRLRARSTGAAVWAGAFAGSDQVAGNIVLRAADGRALRSFNVDASYGFGGLAGGAESVRMNWLYDRFSTDTAGGLGAPAK